VVRAEACKAKPAEISAFNCLTQFKNASRQGSESARTQSGQSNANTNHPAADERAPSAEHWQSSKAWSGTTASDRKFAEWAYNKGHKFLRYVQADLNRSGRLWFGVTGNVGPDEVSALTKSILKGARIEFPGRNLTAKVFDPEGEAIGNATLGADGQIHWAYVSATNAGTWLSRSDISKSGSCRKAQ
jgi:hypothetical protein